MQELLNLHEVNYWGEDVLDSRNLQARIDELLTQKDEHELDPDEFEALSEQEEEELQDLLDAEQAVGSEWAYGATFIKDTHFQDYAREVAQDIGAITGDEGWPTDYIDWERAADALAMDYTEVELQGSSWYVR